MDRFPPIPLESWADTKATLHRFAQIVGKIRLAASPRRNHWWHVPFHLTGRGITTRPMGWDPIVTIDFDFVAHQLVVSSVDGHTVSFPLAGQSVASFYHQVDQALNAVGAPILIPRPRPFDLPDSERLFTEDTEHASYDPVWANRYWQVLSQVNLVLEEFAGGFCGKTSPVHHFWHTLDLAVTRFGDREVEQSADTDPVTREAYSQEVVSFGFWFGDDKFPAPAFYSYTAPEPPGLAQEPLWPGNAEWVNQGGGHLAVLRYDDVRAQRDPRREILGFYESAYRAGAGLAGWDIGRYASPSGITDPQRRRRV